MRPASEDSTQARPHNRSSNAKHSKQHLLAQPARHVGQHGGQAAEVGAPQEERARANRQLFGAQFGLHRRRIQPRVLRLVVPQRGLTRRRGECIGSVSSLFPIMGSDL